MTKYSIGIPKEIKTNEKRIALIPSDIKKLTSLGVKVYIENNAGINANFSNNDYLNVDCIICNTAKEVYEKSIIIIKVKEIQPSEYDFIKSHHIIFTFFHFASNQNLIDAMLKSNSICIAYETIQTFNNIYPILAPMSKIAGIQSMINADKFIKSNLSSVNTNEVISIIGFGNVGMASAEKARELGYKNINIMDKNIEKINNYKDIYNVYEFNETNLIQFLKTSSIIIGSIYISGQKAEKLITNSMLELMKPNSIIMDVAIDQGGITEQSISTTYDNPIIKYKHTNIYCVPNIPSSVPNEASIALSSAIIPYIYNILLDDDIEKTLLNNSDIKKGLNIYKNKNLLF